MRINSKANEMTSNTSFKALTTMELYYESMNRFIESLSAGVCSKCETIEFKDL